MKIVRIRSGDDITYGVADAEGVLVYQGSPFVAWEPTEAVVPWASTEMALADAVLQLATQH